MISRELLDQLFPEAVNVPVPLVNEDQRVDSIVHHDTNSPHYVQCGASIARHRVVLSHDEVGYV